MQVSVIDLYIPRIGLPTMLQENKWNVEIGAEAAQFLFWEYINGIFVAVQENLEREAIYRQETGKMVGEEPKNTTARKSDPL